MAKPRIPKKTTGQGSLSTGPLPSTPSATLASETPSAEPQKSIRKPAMVRTEGRANLVPINLDDEIRRLAYLLSERRGFEPGHEQEDWMTAEREVRQRYRQQSA